MPKVTFNALSDTAIRNAKPTKKQYKLFDGQGLFVLIHPNGSKYFRFRYKLNNKEKMMALGVYPETTLKQARELRMEAQRLVSEGIDPVLFRQEEKSRLETERNVQSLLNERNFEKVAREWLEVESVQMTPKHSKEARRSLENHVFSIIGAQPIDSVSTRDVKKVLLKLQGSGKIETAHRIHQRIRSIFQFAIMNDWTERNPAADLYKLLQPVKKSRMQSLPLKELPEYLRSLDKADNLHYVTRTALKLIIMLFVRTRELIEAKWEEINFEQALWRIPAERMKMRVEHLVPLPTQAMKLIRELHSLTGHGIYIFPGDRNPNQPMSNNTLLYGGIYRMGYRSRATIHGFRTLASSILNESGEWNPDAIERQLAHSEKDQVRAAYNRAQYLEERKRMMQWYADYLEKIIGVSG
jgi:integrase|tara:strand:- start:2014 stop:3246 length:1233 start_codon:yes stop_codon:yes gene_type:complete